MIIYKDIISGDEMFADTFPMKLLHGVVYEVTGKNRTFAGVEVDTGANPSAEGEDDDAGTDPSSVSGIDIVVVNRLVETGFSKKDYQGYIKEFMKKIKTRLEAEEPGEVDTFINGAKLFVKEVLGNFKEYQFFLGEKMDENGLVGLLKWDDVDDTPKMYFFKHALLAEKV